MLTRNFYFFTRASQNVLKLLYFYNWFYLLTPQMHPMCICAFSVTERS
jgi:hypothetical protein